MKRLAVFPLAFLAGSCLSSAPQPQNRPGTGLEELTAQASDDEHCVRLGAGTCERDARCQVLAEPCWCPYDRTCPAGVDCDCRGGVFRACAPARCNPVNCGPARPLLLDEHGCLRCGGPLTCAEAAVQLLRTCGARPSDIAGLHCESAPDCVNDCLHAITSCAEIGCGLCDSCDCGRLGPLERCVRECHAPPAAAD